MENKAVDKKCFIVLPTDTEGNVYGYENGHFGKVFDKMMKPSVLEAGYIPVRRDEIVTGENAEIEIMKELVSAPLVFFDISIKCGWVMTVLGIRQSYKTPVIVIQDDKSIEVLNTGRFEYIAYNHDLTEESIESANSQIIERLNSFNI